MTKTNKHKANQLRRASAYKLNKTNGSSGDDDAQGYAITHLQNIRLRPEDKLERKCSSVLLLL
jgi:hypothetical protein